MRTRTVVAGSSALSVVCFAVSVAQTLSPLQGSTAPEATQPAGQGYYLELGRFQSVEKASRAIDKGMKLLGVQTGSIIETDGRGGVNRAIISAFPTMPQAQAACAKLIQAGRSCEAKPIYP
ncbi:SPOR domain-containing protein [Caulobacter sp. FWC2]|uniref:SPOR domain-containing protein n=1 Tax=Caulobacter sp. FWC2 TaxID=69664 RepID=UPI000C16126D|nr:SPOR domain-containing protein [Caulobacter sp. FWC2]PIB90981.1 hypothetical protein CSW62_04995 [Caulobacter sp. FWC2]